MQNAKIAVFLGAALAFTSLRCVPAQKYNQAVSARDRYKAEYENVMNLEKDNTALSAKSRAAETQLAQMKSLLEQYKTELERVREYNQELSARYEDAVKDNSRLLASYASEKAAMDERLAKNQEALWEQERQLQRGEAAASLQQYNAEPARLEPTTASQTGAATADAAQQQALASLQDQLKKALRDIPAADLTITFQKNQVSLSLSQHLLFGKGSSQVDARGVKALEQLASALKQHPELEVTVIGHTDDQGAVAANWDLSVQRATAVVKLLGINGVPPHRITAAGQGMHRPVVPNASEENRARNRRTEILLSPAAKK